MLSRYLLDELAESDLVVGWNISESRTNDPSAQQQNGKV